MANSCRFVPKPHPPGLRKEGEKRLRNVRELLDKAQKYLGEETGFFDDTHGQGRKEYHNG